MSNLDHRDIGEEMNLFDFVEQAPGMPFYLQNGLALKRVLEEKWRWLHRHFGYEEIQSPQVFKREMWEKSGHLSLYRDQIFLVEDDSLLKPMSCPGAILYYKKERRSWRDLPFKVCELGHVFRQELSGGVQGLLRARSFVQDDAHLFCSRKQICEEVLKVLKLSEYLLKSCGFKKLEYELSIRSEEKKEKYLGDEEVWKLSEKALKESLEKFGSPFEVLEGEAKFYGPAIDVFVEGANGKRWQMSSIQLDFNLPMLFDLKFNDDKGGQDIPVIIHRALFGSLERFMGVLLEFHKGYLPFFLKPVQVEVLLIDDEPRDLELERALDVSLIRHHVRRISSNHLGREVARCKKEKIPFGILMGKKNPAHFRLQDFEEKSGWDFESSEMKKMLKRLGSRPHGQWPEIPSP